jgi:hypothetical protein
MKRGRKKELQRMHPATAVEPPAREPTPVTVADREWTLTTVEIATDAAQVDIVTMGES